MTQRSSTGSIIVGLCLTVLLSACTSKFQQIELNNVPVQVLKPPTREVDLDLVFEAVTREIHKTLPRAYFQLMVFSGTCPRLPQLEGKLAFAFVEVRGTILKQQVIRADASVDSRRELMDLSMVDVSDYYPSTERAEFPGNNSIKKMAAIAHQHISELGLCEGDVTITQLKDHWDVRCGPLENFIQKCHFAIVDGEVRDLK